MGGIAFEWDPGKDSANRRKHRVGFAEASTVFGDPLSITIPDPDHTIGEERSIIVGMSGERSLLVVVHTVRGGCMAGNFGIAGQSGKLISKPKHDWNPDLKIGASLFEFTTEDGKLVRVEWRCRKCR